MSIFPDQPQCYYLGHYSDLHAGKIKPECSHPIHRLLKPGIDYILDPVTRCRRGKCSYFRTTQEGYDPAAESAGSIFHTTNPSKPLSQPRVSSLAPSASA